MMISVFDRVKKEKVLVTSIFSFSHNVLKRLLSQTRQKVSLCGNGFKYSITCIKTPLKGSNKSFSYNRWSLNTGSIRLTLRRVVSKQWSLKAGGLLIQVVSNTGLTVYIITHLHRHHHTARFQAR